MPSYEDIFNNNRRWLEKKRGEDKDFFSRLSEGQNPDYLVIGCSDSRVPPETIMGAEPGELFVHRNIANVVSMSDPNVLSVIEYAVKHLKVKHIVICGHTGCGGIKAAMESEDEDGKLGSWLSNIRYVMQKNPEELFGLDKDESYLRLVELNALQQAANVSSLALVKKSRQETGYPAVHAWIFDIVTGTLRDLDY